MFWESRMIPGTATFFLPSSLCKKTGSPKAQYQLSCICPRPSRGTFSCHETDYLMARSVLSSLSNCAYSSVIPLDRSVSSPLGVYVVLIWMCTGISQKIKFRFSPVRTWDVNLLFEVRNVWSCLFLFFLYWANEKISPFLYLLFMRERDNFSNFFEK